MALLTANNQSMTAITALPSAVAKGGLVLLATETASDDTTLSFTSGIDSSYKEYIFKFIDFNPGTDAKSLTFQGSTNGGSSYGVTATTTWFNAYHNEADTDTTLGYDANFDLANGTGFQTINPGMGGDADQCVSGELWLFNPSSTTFVTHFMAISNNSLFNNYQRPAYMAGYFNATAAITAIQFKMSSGNTDAGTIKMYGIKDS